MALLELRDIKKGYRSPEGDFQPVLDVPSLDLDARAQVALAGTSGSGKTTLLNVIAGLLRPDSGQVRFDGVVINALSEAARDAWRAQNLGYVFQSFHLLGGYTALENVVLGMTFGPGPDRAFARELLEKLELGHRLNHRPSQLSIGQQQRVALARALANRPRVVLADEPTGNLDPRHALEALGLLRGLCSDVGAALLVVSHDTRVLDEFEARFDLSQLNRAATGYVAPGQTPQGATR
ncbi:MAG: ABC transporter ATP-binding protein [Planctomycetota bacterium]